MTSGKQARRQRQAQTRPPVSSKGGPKASPKVLLGAAAGIAGIAAAIERMTDVDIGGFRIGYGSQKHHGSRFVEITMVDHSGKFVR